MNKINYFFSTIVLLLSAVFTMAQEGDENKTEFNLNGELRPRWEMANGYKSPALKDQRAASAIHQRSRLNFDFKAKAHFKEIVGKKC